MPLGILQKKKKLPSARNDSKVPISTIDRTLKRSRKKPSSLPWGMQRRGYRRADDSSSEEETASFDDEMSPEEDFFQRFHVTVVKTAGEPQQETPTEARDNFFRHDTFHVQEQQQLQGRKQVRFHKYDHVMFLGGQSEYVYSLYDREVEAETTTGGRLHDFTDDIGGVVGDVSYFFNCIQQSLQDATGKEGSYDDEHSILSDSGSLLSTSLSSV